MVTKTFDGATGELSFELEADLLSSTAEAAARGFEKHLSETPAFKSVTVNLQKCSMVDSVGLNLLFTLLSRCKELGANTKVIISRGKLDRIMKVAQLGKLFAIECI